ncbi:DUF6344 domain-containing protein [Streptomyces sp. NPDC001941]|uniref:DUF6344 domain-containing protein n=1 Tax=Streptomyces sp. NPDC001941 TaxID=3154659 RepID=UPI003332DF31
MATKVKTFWTAFITLLLAVLAPLGLATSATAAQRPAAQSTEGAADAVATAVRAEVPVQREASYAGVVRDRSLPPTIKQRIGAEAHGSSPSSRHLSAAAPLDTVLTDQVLAAA